MESGLRKDLIQDMLEDQMNAIRSGDIEGFIKWFRHNHYDEHYVRRWFRGYAILKEHPDTCTYEIQEYHVNQDTTISLTLKFCLHYINYDEEQVNIEYVLEFDESSVYIVRSSIAVNPGEWYDRTNALNESKVSELILKLNHLGKKRKEAGLKQWWTEETIVKYCRKTTEKVRANAYSRAIPKSVRFRNTHSEIDCAGAMADMLTMTAARMIFMIGKESLPDVVKLVNEIGKRQVALKEYGGEEDDIAIQELSLKPHFNLDEVLAYKEENQPIFASCVELCSIYNALLYLSGMEQDKIFMVTQPFHYLTLFRMEKGAYVLSTNEIMPMSKNRLYGDTEITRIFSPIYYMDDAGQTNMPEELEMRVRNLFAESVPMFELPEVKERVNVIPCGFEPDLSFSHYQSPEELHQTLREYVYKMGMEFPDSTFSWAKYSYQTLLVYRPEVYFNYSVKSVEVLEFASTYETLAQVQGWLDEHVTQGSIFEEYDRIMTADQVIRHKLGRDHDIALFLAVVGEVIGIAEKSGVILTDVSSYAVFEKPEQQVEIYDVKQKCVVDGLEGEIVVAFDKKNSIAIYNEKEISTPFWLAEMK